MFKPGQKDRIVALVNSVIDIPVVPESLEGSIFRKAIDLIDEALDAFLPKEIQELAESLNQGIERNNAKDFVENLTRFLNKKIILPILTEEQEGKLIGLVVNLLVKSMTKNRTLNNLLEGISSA
jgi:hypothetical protein